MARAEKLFYDMLTPNLTPRNTYFISFYNTRHHIAGLKKGRIFEKNTIHHDISSGIKYVLIIPTMKPRGQKPQAEEVHNAAEYAECACFTCPSQEACKAAQEAEKAAPVEEKIDFSNVEIEPLFKDFVDFETFSKSDFRAVKVLNCEAVPKSKKLLKFTLDDGTGENRVILSGIHGFYEPEQLIGKTCVAITNLPPRPMMGMESCGMLLSALHKENGEERLNLLQLDPHIPAGAKLY